MAKANVLKKIVSEAKRIKKNHPHKYDNLKKAYRWSKGFIKEAARKVSHGHKPGKTVARKRPVKKKASRRKKPVKKSGMQVVKVVKTATAVRAVGKRRRRKAAPVIRRHRSVGAGESGGGTKLLLGLALGGLAIWALTRSKTPTQPLPSSLPPLQQTSNYTRNQQSNDLVAYAMAAGLAWDTISKIIDKLNNSSDQQVQTVYDTVNSTGDFTYLV